MTIPNGDKPYQETDADRRRGILADNALSLDLVSALAGDRLLKKAEKKRLDNLKRNRGPVFFSDLLYSITHQYFPPETAQDLWKAILEHKSGLSAALGRDIKIVVAALDYLTNVTDKLISATLVGEANMEELVGLSLRDGLTGLFNYTYFYQQIDFEVRRWARYGVPVSLMLIDIDDFKEINDEFGHREGDRILASMGKILLRGARDSDVGCRYGGDEFAVILPLTDIREAGVIADRAQTSLVEILPSGRIVTVSVGAAACGKKIANCRDLVEKADAALYQVKKNGKNQAATIADDS
jgi:diguanylate cyclase (GGDEF)-like protein